jgi:tRNA pseudouridine55 synthase
MPSGLLLVDKPAGLTSHDVVGRVRRALRTRRVGHAGTLDPFATGLLVCAVGKATRLLPYVQGEPKVYRTRILFGVATDTDDVTGAPVATGPGPRWDALPDALASLTGPLQQVPPAYSAKHVNGERAYALARRGEPVELKPANITVHDWKVLERGDEWLEAEITCSGGTYVRALARDLGVALGTVAHCVTLRRLQSGPLLVRDAIPFDALRPGEGHPLSSPVPALADLAVQVADPAALDALRVGRQVIAAVEGERVALVGPDGDVVAIGERVVHAAGDRWQPRVVLLGDDGA